MGTLLSEEHYVVEQLSYVSRLYFIIECERHSFIVRMFVDGWNKKPEKQVMRNGLRGFEILFERRYT